MQSGGRNVNLEPDLLGMTPFDSYSKYIDLVKGKFLEEAKYAFEILFFLSIIFYRQLL